MRARSCWLSVSGNFFSHSPHASSSLIKRSRHCSAKCSCNVSCAEPWFCSNRAALTLSMTSSSSLRMSLPMNCICRRLPSKLLIRLASATASTSFSGRSALAIRSGRKSNRLSPSFCSSSLSFLRSVRLGSSPPLSSRLSSRSSSLPSATN